LRINEAIDRFVVVEKSSWKAGSKIGVAKDARHLNFYQDLVNKLSAQGQVVFDFLKIGLEDAAIIISFSYGNTLYPRHSAYLPAHASYSPGIIILADVVRKAFAGKWHEVDLLGLKEDNKAKNYKKYWASGKRETIRLTGYRVRSRLRLLIAAKRLKRILVEQFECKAETINS
jgi:CelD/BcsL family acetyltransferase involved in cellulose biosynthesis